MTAHRPERIVYLCLMWYMDHPGMIIFVTPPNDAFFFE